MPASGRGPPAPRRSRPVDQTPFGPSTARSAWRSNALPWSRPPSRERVRRLGGGYAEAIRRCLSNLAWYFGIAWGDPGERERASIESQPLTAVRADLLAGAAWLGVFAVIMSALMVAFFGWSVSQLFPGALLGAAVFGAVQFFTAVRQQVPDGTRLRSAPSGTTIDRDHGRPLRIVLLLPVLVALAWLVDRWDLGAAFVPGQYVGYALADLAGAVLVEPLAAPPWRHGAGALEPRRARAVHDLVRRRTASSRRRKQGHRRTRPLCRARQLEATRLDVQAFDHLMAGYELGAAVISLVARRNPAEGGDGRVPEPFLARSVIHRVGTDVAGHLPPGSARLGNGNLSSAARGASGAPVGPTPCSSSRVPSLFSATAPSVRMPCEMRARTSGPGSRNDGSSIRVEASMTGGPPWARNSSEVRVVAAVKWRSTTTAQVPDDGVVAAFRRGRCRW